MPAPESSPTSWPLGLLLAGTFISGVGNGVALVVLPWLVLDLTGSAAAAGGVASAALVPLLVASLFSGTVVDIVGRRRTAVVADLLSLVSVAAIPLVGALGRLDVAWLVVLTMAGAALDPAGSTGRETMLPGAATAAGRSWEQVNAGYEAVLGVAFLLGPGLGGLLIGLVGPQPALLVTAGGFAVSALLTALVRVPGAGRPAVHERPGRVWAATVEGFRFVWRDRLLRDTTLLMCLVVAAYLPFESVILPVHFTALDDPGRLGLVVTAMSGGSVVGALAYPPMVRRVGRHRVFVGAVISACVALVGLATLPDSLWLLLLYGGLTGLLWGPVNPILNLAMQVRTPERLRGRVIGVVTSAAYAAGPLGLVLSGPLIDEIGVSATALGFAGVVLAGALTSLLLPSLRELSALQDPGTSTETHLTPLPRADAPRGE